jgi:saccharopine dehydrogenase-like NADP-dependent oxidoreductase
MTDDSYKLERSELLTPRTFLNAFLPYKVVDTVENKLRRYFTFDDEELFQKMEWLGIFDDSEPIRIANASPAQLLEKMLVDKWKLSPNDKDMLVMYHEFVAELDGKNTRIVSSMVNIGENQVYTSMSNTVGLPVAICGKMILNGSLQMSGVHIPVMPEVYVPILNELESFGIRFTETESFI